MELINLEEIKNNASKNNVNQLDVYGDDYLQSCLKNSHIDVNKKYPGVKFIMFFIEEYGQTPVMSLGNISATIGGAKSKKTFFSTMISSGFVSGKSFAFKGYLGGRKLLYVDTEQSRYHVQKIAKRICEITKMDSSYFDILALREFPDPNLRTAIIEYALKKANKNYCMVIIDGLVDLILDFNSISESTMIVNKIMSWSEVYNCHINAILHTNKDKRNARGHLGSILINKAETVFRVTKQDGDSSIVECEASRNRSFKKFEFYVDENGLPERSSYPDGYFDNGQNINEDKTQQDLPF